MNQIFCVFVVVFWLLYGICGVTFKQEMGKVLYTNPKYIKDVTIFTSRKDRRSPYVTSLNYTTKVPYTDNVTFRFEFSNSRFQSFPVRIDVKTCEGFKLKWSKEWLQSYTDVPIICPVMPRTYHVIGFELPPKNFPLQFNNIDYTMRLIAFVTETEESICEISLELKFGKRG